LGIKVRPTLSLKGNEFFTLGHQNGSLFLSTEKPALKHLNIFAYFTDSWLHVHETLKCHLHRRKQICEEEFPPLPRKCLTSTNSANGPKLLVTISKVSCNFWLVVDGMSLCRGRAPCGACHAGLGQKIVQKRPWLAAEKT
jgi:hypothetical protein